MHCLPLPHLPLTSLQPPLDALHLKRRGPPQPLCHYHSVHCSGSVPTQHGGIVVYSCPAPDTHASPQLPSEHKLGAPHCARLVWLPAFGAYRPARLARKSGAETAGSNDLSGSLWHPTAETTNQTYAMPAPAELANMLDIVAPVQHSMVDGSCLNCAVLRPHAACLLQLSARLLPCLQCPDSSDFSYSSALC